MYIFKKTLLKPLVLNDFKIKKYSLIGTAEVPGDKSISHRALIITSMCIGQSKIKGLLESEDVIATMNALKKLGVKIHRSKE